MITIPFGDTRLTGTPAQFQQLALYLHDHAAVADPRRRVRVRLWDDQQIIATYGDLALLADRLAALVDPPARARYAPTWRPAAYLSAGVAFAEPVTQTLNARGHTGGLRVPGLSEAQPANPAAVTISSAPQAYVAQVCRADLQSAWGWTPEPPVFTIQAGHILVAAVRIAVDHQLLLLDGQLLAVRWGRSRAWDCYLPAPLLNSWSLRVGQLLAAHLQGGGT